MQSPYCHVSHWSSHCWVPLEIYLYAVKHVNRSITLVKPLHVLHTVETNTMYPHRTLEGPNKCTPTVHFSLTNIYLLATSEVVLVGTRSKREYIFSPKVKAMIRGRDWWDGSRACLACKLSHGTSSMTPLVIVGHSGPLFLEHKLVHFCSHFSIPVSLRLLLEIWEFVEGEAHVWVSSFTTTAFLYTVFWRHIACGVTFWWVTKPEPSIAIAIAGALKTHDHT